MYYSLLSVLTLALFLPPSVSAVCSVEQKNQAKTIQKKLAARGITNCTTHPNSHFAIECTVDKDWKLPDELSIKRTAILTKYSKYVGGELPIGTFGTLRTLGEHDEPNYIIVPPKSALLNIYAKPELGSPSATLSYASRGPAHLSGMYGKGLDLFPNHFFYDVKNGFLKVQISMSKETKMWGWISIHDVDEVRPFQDLAKHIVGLNPHLVSSMHDKPGSEKTGFQPAQFPDSYNINIYNTLFLDGKFWVQLGFAPEYVCSPGRKATEKEWNRKWIVYDHPDAFIFFTPC